MYDYPGLPSMIIAYFDTNDFYYSGHIGLCLLYSFEYYTIGQKKMGLTGFAITIFMWGFLTIMRVHYFIDLVSGIIVALTAHRIGEIFCFIVDHKLLKLQKNKRCCFWFKSCSRCGWLIDDPTLLTSEEEVN